MPNCLIKFCGLRTRADVEVAVEVGVDAIGFVFADSPRRISVSECQALRAAVPAKMKVHGVFVRPEPMLARHIWRECNLDILQIHGAEEEEEDYWRSLAEMPVVRAFRAQPNVLRLLEQLRGQVFLLDACVAGASGGTGQQCDWTLAAAAAKMGRIILAGGLTPANVGLAIAEVNPWMVDVSSGIERERGKKDHELMRAFAAAVHTARAAE